MWYHRRPPSTMPFVYVTCWNWGQFRWGGGCREGEEGRVSLWDRSGVWNGEIAEGSPSSTRHPEPNPRPPGTGCSMVTWYVSEESCARVQRHERGRVRGNSSPSKSVHVQIGVSRGFLRWPPGVQWGGVNMRTGPALVDCCRAPERGGRDNHSPHLVSPIPLLPVMLPLTSGEESRRNVPRGELPPPPPLGPWGGSEEGPTIGPGCSPGVR